MLNNELRFSATQVRQTRLTVRPKRRPVSLSRRHPVSTTHSPHLLQCRKFARLGLGTSLVIRSTNSANCHSLRAAARAWSCATSSLESVWILLNWGGGSTSAGLWDPAGARHICWLANRPHGLATYPSRSLREFGSLFSWLISCAQARSPPSTYCRARSSQYARFLATCSSNSLMPTPRPFGPNRYNQKLPEQHFLNFPQ